MTPGERLDRYVIERPLGAGGMGEVYSAFDERLRRRVAVKVLKRNGDEPEAVGIVLREARAAAALDHPNAVAIYDVVDMCDAGDRRWAFIVMELVEGTSLRAVMGDGAIRFEERLSWMRQAADALAAAHARGLVHRDVKPENMMITRQRRILKLLDFGIAKLTSVDVHSARGTALGAGAAFTDGHVKGTPRYMSPEQALGSVVDARTDIFAWAVVAYELLVGVHPQDLLEGAAEGLETQAPVGHAQRVASSPMEGLLRERALLGSVPGDVVDVVMAALAAEPEARTASMAAIVHALDARVAGISDPAELRLRRDSSSATLGAPAETIKDPATVSTFPATEKHGAPRPALRRRLLAWLAMAVVAGGAATVVAVRGRARVVPLEAPVIASPVTCTLESSTELREPATALLAGRDGLDLLVTRPSSDASLPVLQARRIVGGNVSHLLVHDDAPAEVAWLGPTSSGPLLFARRTGVLRASRIGGPATDVVDAARTPLAFGRDLLWARRFEGAKVVQIRSNDRDSAALLAHVRADGRTSTLVTLLDQGCAVHDSLEVDTAATGEGEPGATLALGAQHLAVIQPHGDEPATVSLVGLAPSTGKSPCTLTLEKRATTSSLRLPYSVALFHGEPWIVTQTGSHELAIFDPTHTFSLVAGAYVTGGPMLVAVDDALVVVWQEEETNGPRHVVVATVTPAGGIGPRTVLELSNESELGPITATRNLVFVARVGTLQTGSAVDRLRCGPSGAPSPK